MKKLILFMLINLYLLLEVKAQEYKEFAPIGAEWIHHWGPITLDTPPTPEVIHYKSIGDTLFLGKACRKIEVSTYKWSKRRRSFIVYSEPYLFIHSSEAGDTISYYHIGLERFLPLYYYNLNVGDSFNMEYVTVGDSVRFSPLVVDSITLTEVSGESLKTYWFGFLEDISDTAVFRYGFTNTCFTPTTSERYAGYYMEKIGAPQSNFMPFGPCFLSPVFLFTPPYLICYSDHELMYLSSSYSSCNLPSTVFTIASNSKNNLELQLSPNPFTNQITLSGKKVEAYYQIQLIDIQGRSILKYSGSLHEINAALSSKAAQLQAGNYILKIYNKKEEQQIFKILKQ